MFDPRHHAHLVKAHIDRLRDAFPELTEDEEVYLNAVLGETDFDKVMDRLIEGFLDAITFKEAIAMRMAGLRERADRFDRKAETFRAIAFDLLNAAGLPSYHAPVATLSIRKGLQSVEVTDLNAIPQGFYRTEKVPLKTEIKAALQKGDEIPGAALVTGAAGLTIRTK